MQGFIELIQKDRLVQTLLGVFVLAVIGVVAMQLRSEPEPAQQLPVQPAPIVTQTPEEQAAPRPQPRERPDPNVLKIEEYEAAIAAAISDEEAAQYRIAIGNLYFNRLQDFASATEHYQLVIADYPRTDEAKDAYFRLADSIRRQGNEDELRLVYQEMLDFFEEGTSEHSRAESALASMR